MSGKLVPKVIVEGTRLTHKTDLAVALNRHPRIVGPRKHPYPSPLVSAEWCGFTNYPWGRGLINYQPHEADRAMEAYATWARLFELLPYYSWIVDRFHLSTQAAQHRAGRPVPEFGWLEDRLRPLGFRIVLCVRPEDTFASARAERLVVSGNPSQYDDLDVFIAEQRLLRELAGASTLPVLELDTSDDDVAGAADRIADWLEGTGGLTLPDGL